MRYSVLFCLVVFCGYNAAAISLEAAAGHTVFRADGTKPYLQLFWQLSPQSLHYKKDSFGRLTARIRTQIRISSDTGAVYKNVFYLQTKPFNPDIENAPRILEQEQIPLTEGHFNVELFLSEDGRHESRYYYKDTFSIQSIFPQYST